MGGNGESHVRRLLDARCGHCSASAYRACQGTFARSFSPLGIRQNKETSCWYLQDVVVLDALSDSNLFQSLEDLSEVLVRDVVQLGTVVYAVQSPRSDRSLLRFFSGS